MTHIGYKRALGNRGGLSGVHGTIQGLLCQLMSGDIGVGQQSSNRYARKGRLTPPDKLRWPV